MQQIKKQFFSYTSSLCPVSLCLLIDSLIIAFKHRLFFVGGKGLFEFPYALAKTCAYFGQFTRPEDDQYDRQDNNHVHRLKQSFKHKLTSLMFLFYLITIRNWMFLFSRGDDAFKPYKVY